MIRLLLPELLKLRTYSLVLAVFINLLSSTVLAQEPNHHFLGGDFFSGVEIYDLLQDEESTYWIVTSHGLIRYDGYDFTRIDDPSIQAAALFNLRADKKGHIYFNDLSGAVYRIKDQDVELFCEPNGDQTNYNVYLEISENDELLIQAEHLTIADDTNFRIFRYNIPSDKARISFTTLRDGSVICMTGRQCLLFKDDELMVMETPRLPDGTIPKPTAWINVNGRDFGIDQNTMQLFEFDVTTQAFTPIKKLNQQLMGTALRVYAVHDQIWLVGSRNGAFVYDHNWNSLFGGGAVFSDYFISDVYTDREGNVLLSTFDEGILVINDLNLRSYSVAGNSKISALVRYKNSGVLIGTTRGALIFKSDSTEKLLYTSSNGEAVDFIQYSPAHDVFVFATPTGFALAKLHDEKLNILAEFPGAIKSACFDDSSCLIALNYGVDHLDLSRLALTKMEGLNRRAYDVDVDQQTGTLFAVMMDGLFIKPNDSDAERMMLNGKPVRATRVESDSNRVFVGTEEGSLLILSVDQLFDSLSLGSSIQKLKREGNHLLVKTLEKTYLFEASGQKLTISDRYHGIDLQKVSDMACSDDELIFLEDRRYIRTKQSHFLSSPPPLDIDLKDFRLGGVSTDQKLFTYTKKNYLFNFQVATLKYRDIVQYQYRLKGLDETWKSLEYEQHSVEYLALPPGKYEFTVKAVNGVVEGEPVSISFEVDAPFFQKPWFFVTIILSLFILFLGMFRYREGRIKRKNQAITERHRMTADLLEMELKALRSQMNPHFIFNSLNSIQNLVLKQDVDNAYDYLVLFAKLVRSTLNFSNLNFIPIEQEIEFLEVYLSLEKLRMKEGFSFDIRYSGSLDFKVPPLIIQPFVENAIVHGLLHKEGHKSLTIEFKIGEHLTCIITDNGVGRSTAMEIAMRNMISEHESFAMQAIQQRLDLLNKHLGKSIGRFEVKDLEENGQPAGTQVIIQLPVEWKY